MILFADKQTPRLAYMADWLGHRLFGKPMQVVTAAADIPSDKVVLNYSYQQLSCGHYQIMPQGLLQETAIHALHPEVVMHEGMPVFFAQQQGHHPFDMLGAAFYLLSRYEEYLPYEKDEYGRYSHTNSLAWKHGFLKRPLVDEWVEHLKQRLLQQWPSLQFQPQAFRYTPTYDVDMAWSYRNKGLWRNLAAGANDVWNKRWSSLWQRWAVLLGWMRDPFDIFHDLKEFHDFHRLRPVYFLLLAAEYQGYDRNIDIRNAAFQNLVRWLNDNYPTAIHLSWAASQNEQLMEAEIRFMENVVVADVTANRMHYLNFHLPSTFSQLINAGITDDYSMGYGTVNGFRASTSHAFYWYNLAEEQATSLLLHPFAWMEANNIFEQKDTPAQAFEEWCQLHDAVEQVGGHLISICHNHLIGADKQGRQWWNIYWKYIREKVDKDWRNREEKEDSE